MAMEAMEAISNHQESQGTSSAQSTHVETKPIEMTDRAQTVEMVVDQILGQKQEEKRPRDSLGGKVAESTVRNAVKKTNEALRSTKCEFSYHEETHRVSIRVLDKKTDKVIREIPPEKSLEMLEKMWEMAGILVDEKR